MHGVMQEMERVAQGEAAWNADGEEVTTPAGFTYDVTGTARLAITGYAVGQTSDPFKYFSVEGNRKSPSGNTLPPQIHETMPTPMPPEIPGVVQGILTMAEDHAAYLQEWELGQKKSAMSVSPSGTPRGQVVTVYTLEDHRDEFIVALSKEAALLLSTIV
jgi:hypothetical protein